MGERTRKGAARRRETIGLPDDVAYRAVDVLAAAVGDTGVPITRADCADTVQSQIASSRAGQGWGCARAVPPWPPRTA